MPTWTSWKCVTGVITVQRDPARRVTYAELIGGRRFDRQVSGQAPLKAAGDYQTIGTSVERVDLPQKFTGQTSFVHDLRLPGMLHGRVLPPPSVGATLLYLDRTSVDGIGGLVKLVHIGNFVGVVAEREEQAIAAAEASKSFGKRRPPIPSRQICRPL